MDFFLFFLNRSKVEKKEPESFFFREKLKQLRDRKKTLLLERSERFFEHLFDYSLTNEQVDAVINDSKNCMVIASAGSGKTSTIVAKFGYLIQTKDITESEILVLAFNNKVSKEIKQNGKRTKKRSNK